VLQRDLTGLLQIIAAYESARATLATHDPDALARVEQAEEELDWEYVRENLDRMLNRTRDGVQRVADIVQNLRGLARTAPPKMEPALLSDLVAAALEMVRGRMRRRHIEAELDLQATDKILCVSTQIGQVLLNLLVNAIQAVEAAGRNEGNRIRIATRAEPGWQVLEVIDNGCGIAPEAMPHLFDPFYTSKPVGEGTGLGLSISHGIITGHGGQIEVESTPGVGSIFRIRLPTPTDEVPSGSPHALAPRAAPPEPPPTSPSASPHPASPTPNEG
jgi:signal transduction histidine kinase